MNRQVPNPPHPGEFIKNELKAREWPTLMFADLTEINPSVMSQILNGRTDINAKRAIAIGVIFGTGPEMWQRLQNVYDLWKAGYRDET